MTASSRRTVLQWLVGGAVVAGGVAGCTAGDPAVRPTAPVPQPPTPPGPPPPPPGLDQAIAGESLALAWCRALVKRRYKLSDGQLSNLRTAADLHQRHLVALELPSPQTRPAATQPSASPTPGAPAPSTPAAPSTSVATPTLPTVKLPKDQDRAIKEFGAALDGVRKGHRELASAAEGQLALLWGSLAAGAAQTSTIARTARPAPRPAAEPEHPAYRVMTPTAAGQELLAQLHAMVFGYQVALAPIPAKDADPYRQRLAELLRDRDELADLLRDLDAEVPAAAPEYDTGGRISDEAAAVKLVARMEHALLPHLGNWLAATAKEQRARATDWLVTGTVRAVRAGAAPVWWPGWPD